ncbi:PREDICTED: uncharacterized protein LOC105461293 [Wasmannia auropunctata]|nr:PREDICTED: uncharacterized protein LOC105456147 isoform X2 [Wasmannia auropunctata]XP_011706086.1 PREDICTED: uncharacterized protein LOC105461293 [Wasmannia auropunctata]
MYDNTSGKLKTIFMPPPYTTETVELLYSLVKSRAEPSKSWPSYEIKILGDAKTYESATIKLKELGTKEYAYSTESDHGKARSLSDTKKYKLKAFKTDCDIEKELLNVPLLNDSDDSLVSECSRKSECKYLVIY